MKTDDLIRALAADSATRPMPLRRALIVRLDPGRRDRVKSSFSRSSGSGRISWRCLRDPRFCSSFASPSCSSCFPPNWSCASRRPGAGVAPRRPLAGDRAGPSRGRQSRGTPRCSGRALGPKADRHQCPRLLDQHPISWRWRRSLPLCSALRQGAPEHPALAGAAAGLLAGAIGAALYATHCPDDSPLFVAAWYSLAIGFVVALGAVAGARLLRW